MLFNFAPMDLFFLQTDGPATQLGELLDKYGINYEQILLQFGVVLGAMAIGWIVERILMVRLRALARKTAWAYDDIVVKSLRGLIVGLFGAVSLFFLPSFFELKPKFIPVLNDIATVGLIVVGTLFLARFMVLTIDKRVEHSEVLQSSSIIRITTRIVIYSIGILVILQTIGVSVAPILGALGVGGLAVALALQDTLGNLFAGIQIILTQKFRKGDYVELADGHNGSITDITWRNITLRTIYNNLIIVPNNKFSSIIVKNYNFPEGVFNVPITIGVHYDSDLEYVEEKTMEVAFEVQREVVGELEDFKPFMWYHTFNASSIDFDVLLRAKSYAERFPLAHTFIKRLNARYNEIGIEIPFPIQNLYFRNKMSLENGSYNRPAQPDASAAENGGGSNG